ncbi:hypothetical protein MO867_15980 [Microbulbifer sp. OS29]|uniref:Uncharacterized protein n=1 Tax=Microbulbifer okhotskensis TaxID=2926617 RepID=A0A9X2J6V8_9GAMM|nr:hypothetical protein [Microbulbifer okhotskensis]MCO1335834.1 hypothetical protein [Microbulbifer okhotskensis]
MRVSISSEETSCEDITYNDGLNYGRFDLCEFEVFPYKYSIGKDEFVSLMYRTYEDCRKEIRRDDISCNEISSFSQMNYADIISAFDHPEAFAEAIENFFDRELFEKTLGYSENKKFIINSTEKVEVSNDKITIIGRCFRRQ